MAGSILKAFGLAALAATLGTGAAWPQAAERCYGVSKAGENDGIDDAEAAGGATVDFRETPGPPSRRRVPDDGVAAPGGRHPAPRQLRASGPGSALSGRIARGRACALDDKPPFVVLGRVSACRVEV
jgi:hypothetical protein